LLSGEFHDLGNVKLKSGKLVHAWAIEGDLDTMTLKSNEIEMEWPPKSGKKITIHEVDRAEWFGIPEAMEKIILRSTNYLSG